MPRSTQSLLTLLGAGFILGGWIAAHRWLQKSGEPADLAAKPALDAPEIESTEQFVDPASADPLSRASIPEVEWLESPATNNQGESLPSGPPAQELGEEYNQWRSRWSDAQELPPTQWYGERIPTDPAVFEAKYSGYSTKDLDSAYTRVSDGSRARRREAFADRFESGQFERHPVDPTRPVRIGTTAGNAPIRAVRRTADLAEIQVAQLLPFEEYADLYGLEDEAQWLANAISSGEH